MDNNTDQSQSESEEQDHEVLHTLRKNAKRRHTNLAKKISGLISSKGLLAEVNAQFSLLQKILQEVGDLHERHQRTNNIGSLLEPNLNYMTDVRNKQYKVLLARFSKDRPSCPHRSNIRTMGRKLASASVQPVMNIPITSWRIVLSSSSCRQPEELWYVPIIFIASAAWGEGISAAVARSKQPVQRTTVPANITPSSMELKGNFHKEESRKTKPKAYCSSEPRWHK